MFSQRKKEPSSCNLAFALWNSHLTRWRYDHTAEVLRFHEEGYLSWSICCYVGARMIRGLSRDETLRMVIEGLSQYHYNWFWLINSDCKNQTHLHWPLVRGLATDKQPTGLACAEAKTLEKKVRSRHWTTQEVLNSSWRARFGCHEKGEHFWRMKDVVALL